MDFSRLYLSTHPPVTFPSPCCYLEAKWNLILFSCLFSHSPPCTYPPPEPVHSTADIPVIIWHCNGHCFSPASVSSSYFDRCFQTSSPQPLYLNLLRDFYSPLSNPCAFFPRNRFLVSCSVTVLSVKCPISPVSPAQG